MSSLPQGLTCQLWYEAYSPWPWESDFYEGETCRPAFDIFGNYNPASGYVQYFDGDFGLGSGDGFRHLEYTTGTADIAVSTLFALPKGTACGFHHTRNSPGRTCMGYDAQYGCPAGWIQKKHFDMSSDWGYYAWCEYQDPNALCDGTCLVNALYNGYACGVSSDTDSTGIGQCGGQWTNSQGCPAGARRSPYLDSGRPSGQGIAWCHD